ncbi:hypothetical protein HAHE_26150 [Haloferula helveola]|uniref:Chromosome partition protein Smc n=1 Tax=Haloferula helveola TaxID=490095 RepID=A0ABM7RF19_9BACT|nr:hypothetical protein HAHE_26150 [Haloferula helveola]
MTTTRYLLARIALAFGISRRQRRMAEAASETHLLREAEQILGERVWERVETVEELGIEYWTLRRLIAEKSELLDKHSEAEEVLQSAHDQRAALLSAKSDVTDELDEQRADLLEEMDELARHRDDIVRRARDIRRLYDGIKTKLEVLRAESRDDTQTVSTAKTRMEELRLQFESLKHERTEIATKIAKRNEKLDAIDERIDAERKKHRSEAAEAFQMIGDANRKISSFKAEIGLIEQEMQQLFGEIGRHVSRNAKANPVCRAATTDFQSMVEVMSALRKSINLNHRLTGA